jgi:hypothetical protein
VPLAKLGAALRVGGVLELMVYNYYHRILTTAFQKAMRHLFGDSAADLDTQLEVTRSLMNNFPVENMMNFYLRQQKDESREYLADSFLQPVEHSYTVASFVEMVEGAGLEVLLPGMSVFDKDAGRLAWNIEFRDPEAARRYDALPDYERWQVSNLLLVEMSPTIYFYVQRRDSGFERKSEKDVCREFLETRFERYGTTATNYVNSGGEYKLSPAPVPHPSPRLPVSQTARNVFKWVDPGKTLGEVLEGLGIEPTFHTVNNLRAQLTTPLFPYLKAAAPR